MALSCAENSKPRRLITTVATSKAFEVKYVEKPLAPPQLKLGIKLRGNPLPNIFELTPITVPVLNPP